MKRIAFRANRFESVYVVVENSQPEPCKIGTGVDPLMRLSMLQVGNPRPLAIGWVAWLKGWESGRKVEARAHALLAAKSLRGEWFSVDVNAACDAIRQAAAEAGLRCFTQRQLEVIRQEADAFARSYRGPYKAEAVANFIDALATKLTPVV